MCVVKDFVNVAKEFRVFLSSSQQGRVFVQSVEGACKEVQ